MRWNSAIKSGISDSLTLKLTDSHLASFSARQGMCMASVSEERESTEGIRGVLCLCRQFAIASTRQPNR